MRTAHRHGLSSVEPPVDFPRIMNRVRAVREHIYEQADRPEHLARFGVEVALGRARLLDRRRLEVLPLGDGQPRRIRARRLILATGARPAVPPIPGLSDVPYLTTDTLFELEQQPHHMLVLGAGPVGVEMAQAFARLGTAVILVGRADRLLQREDPEAADLVRQALEAEGVDVRTDTELREVRRSPQGLAATLVPAHHTGSPETVHVDTLLVATGRRPNVDGVGLTEAGIHVDGGVLIDRSCRTSARGVYAVGDVTNHPRLTHLAEHMGKIAATNAVLRTRGRIDLAHLPWCTFSDPEVARVGATEAELEAQGRRFEVHRFPYDMSDRAVTEGETTGFIKVCATRWRGKILGVAIAGAGAGDLIAQWAVAMRHGLRLRHIADTIHPYPTHALANRRAADQWYVRRRALWLLAIVRWVFRYRGQLQPFGKGPV
jgi:pyruvate/2-oxoglutarate dehydrogenase complex dihydrolipoamide dehydrogenase (E3) component